MSKGNDSLILYKMKNVNHKSLYDMIFDQLNFCLKSLVLTLALVIYSHSITAQESNPLMDQKISLTLDNVPIQVMVDSIQSKVDAKLYFKADDHQDLSYTINATDQELSSVLDQLFAPTDYSYVVYRDNHINIVPAFLAGDDFSLAYFQVLEGKLDQTDSGTKKASDGIVVGDINNIPPSGIAKVNGKITDGKTGEEIIGATIQWLNTSVVGITDANGIFESQIKIGPQIVQVQYIGYQTLSRKVNILSDGQLALEMFNESVSLEEIVISERASNELVQSEQISIERFSAKEIEKLPTFLGETDVIQTVLNQPGVSSVGEGSIGFNVRGGDADQNLILQDEAIIFNPSHALGFFGTFNTELIRGVDLYKGIMPAQFGGRISSVLDVKMRDGNFDEFKINAGIGLVSGKLALEGPIKKGKTSFITGVRSNYSDYILNLVDVEEVNNSSASFFDWNGRITHRFSDKSSLVLSGYVSNDQFVFNNEFGFDYSTRLAQVLITHGFTNNLISKTSIAASNYSSTQNDFDIVTPSDFKNDINYIKFKEVVTINPDSKFAVDAGFSSIFYSTNPGQRIATAAGSEGLSAELDQEQGLESAVFLNAKLAISEKFTVSGGLRFSAYQNLGPASVFIYEPDAEILVENIIDTLQFDSGVVESYFGLEPRASIRYLIDDATSIKAGYSRTTQYINQIFNTDSPTPTSQWQLSNFHIEPTRANNVSIGLFKNLKENNYETSLSIFARSIDQLFDYRDFADLLVNDHIETELLNGEGRAYGTELSIKKKTGIINGTFSYTFSRSERRVEGINNNDWYPSNFDRPHKASLIVNYQPNQRNTVSINLNYSSGRPTTPPVAGFVTSENVFVPVFTERNQRRIPDFQRIDLAYTFGEGYKKDRKFRLSWTLSIYNLLGRENAFSVFFDRGAFNVPQPQQLAILGSAFPSISFNIDFL